MMYSSDPALLRNNKTAHAKRRGLFIFFHVKTLPPGEGVSHSEANLNCILACGKYTFVNWLTGEGYQSPLIRHG